MHTSVQDEGVATKLLSLCVKSMLRINTGKGVENKESGIAGRIDEGVVFWAKIFPCI